MSQRNTLRTHSLRFAPIPPIASFLLLFLAVLASLFHVTRVHADVEVHLPGPSEDMVLDEPRNRLYVSLPYGSRIIVLSNANFAPVDEVVLEHAPGNLELSADGKRLYVAPAQAASPRAITVVHLDTMSTSTIDLSGYVPSFHMFDMVEVRGDRLLVASGHSSQNAALHVVRLDHGDVIAAVPELHLTQGIPAVIGDPGASAGAYLLAFPNSYPGDLYRLDFSVDPGVVTRRAASDIVVGVTSLSAAPGGALVALSSGATLQAETLWPSAVVSGRPAAWSGDGRRLFTAGSQFHVYDVPGMEFAGSFADFCAQSVYHRLLANTDGSKLYGLRDHLLCVQSTALDTTPTTSSDIRVMSLGSFVKDAPRGRLLASIGSEIIALSGESLELLQRWELGPAGASGLDLSADGSKLFATLPAIGGIASLDFAEDTISTVIPGQSLGLTSLGDVTDIGGDRLAFSIRERLSGSVHAATVGLDTGVTSLMAEGAPVAGASIAYDDASRSLYMSEQSTATKLDLTTPEGTLLGHYIPPSAPSPRRAPPALSPDGSRLVTARGDVVDTATLSAVGTLREGYPLYDDTGARLHIVSRDGLVATYDATTLALESEHDIPCRITGISSAIPDLQGTHLIVSGTATTAHPYSGAYRATCRVPLTATPAADIAVSFQPPAGAPLEAPSTYGILVTNHGPSTAAHVYVESAIPPLSDFVGVTTSHGSCIQAPTHWCYLGNLAVGETATIHVAIETNNDASLEVAARAASENADPVRASNTLTAAFPTAIDVERYYPLGPGYTWDYATTGGGSARFSVTSTSRWVNGVETVEVTADDGSAEYFTNDELGIRLHQQFSPGENFGDGIPRDARLTFQPPIVLAQRYAQIDHPVQTQGAMRVVLDGLGTYNFQYTAVATVQQNRFVTLPSQRRPVRVFPLDFQISFQGTIAGQVVADSSHDALYLARDIGPARILWYELPDPGTVLALTAVDIDPDDDDVTQHLDNCPALANQDQADNDSDGEGDACDNDDDGDGVADHEDDFPLDASRVRDFDLDGQDDARDPDDDNDGMFDDWEEAQGFDPFDASDAALDADGDGRSNLDEFLEQTDPHEGISAPRNIQVPALPIPLALLLAGALLVRSLRHGRPGGRSTSGR